MKITKRRSSLAMLTVLLGVVGCNGTPFEVIEETSFDPSLGIVLSEFELLDSGVYRKDLVVGGGVKIQNGTVATVSYVGHLSNGVQFGQGSFVFLLGAGKVIPGFELGVYGMNVGGVRRIIIPPELGYGDAVQQNIPPGSVIIFDVTVDNTLENPTTPEPVGSGS